MTKPTILIIVLAAVVLDSCTATHFGAFSGGTVLIPTEHRYAGSVSGAASASYFLGEGGMLPQGLAAEAKANMLSKFPMRDGLILTNFTTDIKTSYILCFTKRTLMLSADVIDVKQTTLPYGLQNGYFINDTTFFEFPTLEMLIEQKMLKQKNIKPEDFMINNEDGYNVGNVVAVMTLNNKVVTGKIVDISMKYGFLCKTEIAGKIIYIYKHPRSITHTLNN